MKLRDGMELSPNKRPKWLGFSYPEELRNNCEKSSESHSETHSESPLENPSKNLN